MKTSTQVACIVMLCSFGGNMLYASHLYSDWRAADTLCKQADRYACGMRAVILNLGTDTPPAKAEKPSGADVIGEMIKAAERAGIATPPKAI